IAQVVVALADLAAAPFALEVDQARQRGDAQVGPADHAPVQVGRQQSLEEAVQGRSVPASVHVGLAQRQRTARQQACRHLRIPELQVPGPVAAEHHVSRGEQGPQPIAEPFLAHAPRLRAGPGRRRRSRPVYCGASAVENSGRYSAPTCGSSTLAGTSATCTPSEYGPTWYGGNTKR